MTAALPALLYLVPLGAALAFALGEAVAPAGWAALVGDPRLPGALKASLWIGAASTLLALAASLAIVTALYGSAAWRRLERGLGAALAVPHAAFAIGLALLIAPSGALMRVVAPWAGWQAPPPIDTLHEPLGLSLIGALVLKEVPFLLWNIAAVLHSSRHDLDLRRQLQVAASLGYGGRSAWWRVIWPQWLPRLAWPLLAVWAYGLSVVDMALVLGPDRPPTLAVLAWQWLQDADVGRNAQGAAAALLLCGLVAAGVAVAWACVRATRPLRQAWAVRGVRPEMSDGRVAAAGPIGGVALYALVVAMLAMASVAGVWTFPALWPQQASGQAWATVAGSLSTLGLTGALGALSAAAGLVLATAWLELAPPGWDHAAAAFVYTPMVIPGVLLAAGLYRLTLWLGIDASLSGLVLAHAMLTAPYALLALAPAYRSFDPRHAYMAAALGRRRIAFLWRVKWPMLAVPMAAALAVAFAVSVAQYLPTQFVGAGRYATVTTEAVTLAAGGQRTLSAAFGLTQLLLPAIAFGLVGAWARRGAERHAELG